ncbi:MAG: ABC transporter ATP-binding protein [Candidatus Thorarchaeota archaeon]|nr:ABC transporter ATP-binding protein [Candidatus Thorarchaeota archaeon]
MNEESTARKEGSDEKTVLELLQVQEPKVALGTLLTALFGAVIYIVLKWISWPYIMVDLFTLGLLPALAVIALVGAIRGPIAGLLTGYLGELLAGTLLSGTMITMTLPAFAYGFTGLVVGLASYELDNGRSLVKLSIMSIVGMTFTLLLVTVIGLTIEGAATMAVIGFVTLPLLTQGMLTVAFLTPVFGRIWYAFMIKVFPTTL